MAGFFESTNDPANPDSYDSMVRRRRLLDAMMARAPNNAPIRSWTEGLAGMVDKGVNNYNDAKLREEEKANNAYSSDVQRRIMEATFGGGSPSVMSAPAGASSPPMASAEPSEPSPTKQAFVEQMMPHAMKVAQETGVDPRIVIAQAALESGYGKSAPGNNFFGIKSHGASGGQTLATNEVVNGQNVRTNDSFRQYGGMGDSAMGYAQFLKSNPRYAPMLQAQGMDAQIAALAKSGYATDPNYGSKISSIARSLPAPNGASAINGALRADMPAPGAQDSGGAPMPAGVNMPPPQLPGSAPIPSASGFSAPMGIPQNVDPANNAAELAAADPVAAPAAAPAPAPAPAMSGRDKILAATQARAANPQAGDTLIPAGSADAQAATRLEGDGVPAPGAVNAQFAIPGQTGADRGRALIAAALADPRLSPQQKQMALQMYTMTQKDNTPIHVKEGETLYQRDANGGYSKIMGGDPKKTNDQLNYDAARAGGFQGSFTDYVTAMKKAGATNVSIDQKTEGAFDQKIAGKQADLFSTLSEEGMSAKTDLANIGVLRSQIDKLPGGFMGGALNIANSYGIKLGPNASNVEAANAVISKLVPAQRQGMPGAASDRDVQMFKDSLPKLSNTPGGNKIILDTMEGLARYKAAQGEIAGAVMTGRMNRNEAMQRLQDLPDPMAAFKKMQGADVTSNDGWQEVSPGVRIREKR